MNLKYNKEMAESLDKEQLAAVEAPIGNICINAIAGSGKTRVLTNRVANMIFNGYNESEMVLLTFTDKAAQEMKSRIKEILGRNELKLFAGTFHSIASRFLRKYATTVGRNKNFTILTPYMQKKLIDNCRTKVLESHGTEKDNKFPECNVLADIYSSAINHNLTFAEIMKLYYHYLSGEQIDKIITIFEDYVTRKYEENLVDFDDLLISFYDILNNPETYEEITSHIKYVFVDEYQDINQIQYEILQKLNRNQSIFVIGDTAQCIYQFRGSRDEYIEEFALQYPNPHIYNITYNYRSDQKILSLAESVINKNRYTRTIKCNTMNQDGALPIIYQATTPMDEANQIAELIKPFGDQHGYNEVAVIVRKGVQASIIEQAFKKKGIPYSLGGQKSVYEQPYMKDLIALIAVHSNYKDETSFIHAIRVFPGVREAQAKTVYMELKKAGFNLNGLKAHFDNNTFKAYVGIKKIIMAKTTSVGDLINFITNTIFAQYVRVKYANAEEKLTEVKYLAKATQNITETGKFLDLISLGQVGEKEKKNENAVTIMTMHKSKGLEWDLVFIPFLTKGTFPRCRPKDYITNEQNVKNERNLLYVGITRARYQLFLSYSMFEDNQKAGPSQFIEELEEDNRGNVLFKIIQTEENAKQKD
mgnify:FL=1